MRRRPATILLICTAAAVVVDLVRVLVLDFNIEPTDGALFSERVGHGLMSFVVVALALMAAAGLIRWRRPQREPIAGVVAGLALTCCVAGWAWASWRQRGPAPERAVLAHFRPPTGAIRLPDTFPSPSDPPSAERSWRLAGRQVGVCDAIATEALRWAPGAIRSASRSSAGGETCSFTRQTSGQVRSVTVGPDIHSVPGTTITARVTRR